MVLLSALRCGPRVLSSASGRCGAGGATGGDFSIELVGGISCTQSYIENTAVLVSVLEDAKGGAVEITDFAPRFKHYDRTFRPPQIVRRVRPIRGALRIRVRLRPRFDWGARVPELTRGSNHLRFVGPRQTLRVTTDASVSYLVEETPFALDKPVSFFFGSDEPLRSETDATAREFLEDTIAYWQDWVRSLSIPFDWQEAVIRAAIT